MIDDHVHPIPGRFTPLDLPGITLDVEDDADGSARRQRLAPGRLALHLLTVRLARLLNVGHDEAVAARDEMAAGDWPGWVRRLLDDADVTGMIVDEAVAPGQISNPQELAELTARPVWHMARIDTVVDHLIGEGADAAGVLSGVERFMADAVAEGAVAFKTILAYRTGLAVDPAAGLEAAHQALDADRDLAVRRRAKPLRDLVMRSALGWAADAGRPFQIHTGFGDSQLRLAESNPLGLEELLRTPEGAAASIVLIHGSYPWHSYAAYLAATRPNVAVELSLSNLFAPAGVADRLLDILDLAPAGRVLLGSDGHGAPETHWFGCLVLRDAWEEVAARLGRAGADTGWLWATRERIFEANARRIYSLN